MASHISQYDLLYVEIAAMAENTPLLFRIYAKEVYSAFLKKNRTLFRRLSTKDTSTLDVIEKIEEDYLPLQQRLQSQQENSVFINALTKHLKLNKIPATMLASELVMVRQQEVQDECVDAIYYISERKQRNALALLLANHATLKKNIELCIKYTVIQHVAKEQKIAIYDAVSPRLRTQITEKRQIRMFTKKQSHRLHGLECEVETIVQSKSGVLAYFLDNGIELTSVYAVHQDYKKKLAALSTQEKRSTAKQYDIIESLVQRRLGVITKVDGDMTLDEERQRRNERLSAVFDVIAMTQQERNELMKDAQRLKELNADIRAVKASLRTR